MDRILDCLFGKKPKGIRQFLMKQHGVNLAETTLRNQAEAVAAVADEIEVSDI